MQWILSEESKMQRVDKNFKIRHAKSFLGEKRVMYRDEFGRLRHYKLDGYFVDAEENQHAMEFNGCWYHGCPRCYPHDRESLQVMEKTLQQQYIEMLKKKKILQELGLIVHGMWYCNYKLYHISNDLKVVEELLRIRDAYLGGRTNAINLKEEFSNETKGGYVDFCSLYLHVLKYENHPIGHPVHINGNFTLPISSFACSTKPCPILGTEDCNGKHLKLN